MTPTAQLINTLFSAGTLVADVAIVLAVILYIFKPELLAAFVRKYALVLGLVVSGVTTLSSIVYSSIIGFVPCELCWMQRIFLFPQIIVFAVALYFKNKGEQGAEKIALAISLCMSAIGALIAAFQYYGQMFNAELLAACEASGISCSKLYFVSFGYITIPMMALTSFLLLALLSVYYKKGARITQQ